MLLASSVCGLFKWRQFEPEVILLAVGWYLRFSLSYRDVEELLADRGLHPDHVTIWRWVQSPGNGTPFALEAQTQPATVGGWMRPTSPVKGKWVYLYRAVDSTGATIDFLLSAKRDTVAAKRFLAKALEGLHHPHPSGYQHRQGRRLPSRDRAAEPKVPSRRIANTVQYNI